MRHYRLIEKGGDWDRRNRLKVYRGLHLLSIRQFAKSGELLLDRSVIQSATAPHHPVSLMTPAIICLHFTNLHMS
jgi:hypothetical protein